MKRDTELTVGERLKKARATHIPKLNQHEVAVRSGVSQPTISDLERGISNNSTKLAELASALNVNMIWLATGSGEMRNPEAENRSELQRLAHAIQRLDLSREQIELVVDNAIAYASKLSFKE
ncbi:helix-turn-helix domain-containing protein [Vibrio parahaemolyticus]